MSDIQKKLFDELGGSGMKARFTSIERVSEIKADITGLLERKIIDPEFYSEYLSHLNMNYRFALPEAQSILAVAVPQLPTRLVFKKDGKECRTAIPPAYRYRELQGRIEKILERVLSPEGYGYRETSLPAKLLAVRTGLGAYGRNNICYVDGMGSYARLFSYYLGIQCGDGGDTWGKASVMPECGTCSACISACPAGCIDKDRFLVNAENCLTKFNERIGDFPDWIEKGWHNAIVGCMKCQAVCPANGNFYGKIENEVVFEDDETSMILKNTQFELLPYPLQQKIYKLDLTDYFSVLPRNLSLLME